MKLDEIDLLPRFSPPLQLERVTRVLSALDLLNPDFPWVHVAGTKGKGSTSVFLANILSAANYKTGLFLSPHLSNPNERISIQLTPVDQAYLENASLEVDRVLEINGIGDISFFEYWTALSMVVFHRKQVDIAIMETGLGGRLDATSAIHNPVLCLFTLIGRDHVDRLGHTVEEIAREKAEIIRSYTSVVSAQQLPSVEEILKTNTHKHRSKFYSVYSDYEVSFEKGNGFETGKMNILSYLTGIAYTSLEVSLIGKHQLQNASLALAAAEILAKSGFCVQEKSIRSGLKQAFIPGRMEKIEYKNRIILLDGAHNPDSFYALKETLTERFPKNHYHFLFGSLINKLIDENVQILSTIASSIWLTPIPGHESLTTIENNSIVKPFSEGSLPDEILHLVLSNTTSEDLLVITGSLYLVGWFRQWFYPNKLLYYKTY